MNEFGNKRTILILGCKNYPAFSSEKVISGGMEIYVWELVKYLKYNYNIILISGYSYSSDDSIKVISVPVIGGLLLQPISLFIATLFVCTSLLIKREKIELINAQTPLFALIAYMFKIIFKIPYVVSVHIYASSSAHIGMLSGVYGVIERIVLSNADRVISAGYKLRLHLLEKYKIDTDRLVVIHPGMDVINTNNELHGNKYQRMFAGDDACKLLFLGRLIKENGIMDILEAMTYLKNESIKLLIAGNGNLGRRIKSYVKRKDIHGKIVFLGVVRGKEKYELLQHVDIIIRTSYHEVFPVAYLEAIANGKPVIATPVGDTEYLARVTGAVTLVPVKSPREVARTIKKLMNNKKLTSKEINKCNAFISKTGWKKQAEMTHSVFKSILEI